MLGSLPDSCDWALAAAAICIFFSTTAGVSIGVT